MMAHSADLRWQTSGVFSTFIKLLFILLSIVFCLGDPVSVQLSPLYGKYYGGVRRVPMSLHADVVSRRHIMTPTTLCPTPRAIVTFFHGFSPPKTRSIQTCIPDVIIAGVVWG